MTDDPGLGAGLTSAQIARLAGVSVATVSKVLNGRSEVAPATRAAVEAVIREHGHRRQKRPAARAPLVELLVPGFGGYAMELLTGAGRVAAAHGLGVVVTDATGDVPEPARVTDLLARRPAGVVAAMAGPSAAERARMAARRVPLVVVDPAGEPDHGVPSVGAGNWSGGLAATRHLLDLGHRRIGVVTGPAGVLSARARLDGHRAALDEVGAAQDPALVLEGAMGFDDGERLGARLLAGPERPTAVVAANDVTALGVLRAAAAAGLRVPGDVSVVGFDDLPASRCSVPALTTVHQPLAEMAATAVRTVVALAAGRPAPGERVLLATRLVVRGTTGPVPR